MRQEDLVSAAQVARLAASLDIPMDSLDGVLPPLWHWLFWLDAPPASMLGVDGHRARGGEVELDAALPRRMWAGGRLRLHRAIHIGQLLTRETMVLRETVREGRNGTLRFVTLRHVVRDAAGMLIEEEQDLVYRAGRRGGAAAAAAPDTAPATPPSATPPDALIARLIPDAVLLFRFSALTFNSHRIHYDLPYATGTEGYAGLVVHGPLQAVLLAAHARRVASGRTLGHFAYRAVSPAIAGAELTLEAWATRGAVVARSRAPSGAICMTAEAEFDA